MFPARHALLVILPLGLIVLGFGEAVADHLLHAHACPWVAPFYRPRAEEVARIALPLWILAQRKFDPRLSAVHQHLLRTFAPAELHHHRLSANCVRAAMQYV